MNVPINIKKAIRDFIGYNGDRYTWHSNHNWRIVYVFDHDDTDFEGGTTTWLNVPIEETFRSKFVFVPYYNGFYTLKQYHNLINNKRFNNSLWINIMKRK